MTIDDIKIYPNNARKHNEKQIQLLAENIEKFGFDQPIVLWDKTNEVIKGHGRLEAARLLGWTECREATIALKGEKFIPIQFQSYKTASEANAARIADNKTSEMSEWDMELLLEEYNNLDEDDKDFVGLDDFDESVNSVDEEWQGMPEVNAQKIEGAVRSILVHFETEEDVESFAEATKLRITDLTRFIWFPQKEKEKIKDFVFKTETE